ncbi:O-antigen ligase family protein [Aliagarivorans marinus]|uniref:O-antigen ligase family protein n=1 Tax=Aliagarivorans marinus TaxID=561965 RepID=UPI00041FE886|nr:O-antigen ligase family protein [Aliagarivorans marinus]
MTNSTFLHPQLNQSLIALGCCLVPFALWYLVPNPLIPIAFAILPVALVSVFRFPFLMVMGFVLFSFFRLHEAYPQLYPLRIPQLLALASLATLAWHLGITRKLRIFWCRELTWLGAFFFWCLVTVVMASNRGLAIAYFNGVFSKIIIMTFAIAWLVRKPEDLAKAALACIVSGIAVAYVALYNAQHGLEMVEGTRVTIGRSFGSVLGDPNDLALTLMFPMGFAAAWAMDRTLGLRRWVAIIGFVCLFMALLATQSRGGLLGVLTLSGVLAWRRVENKALLIGAGAIAMPILFVVAGISDRSSGGAAESGIDESSMGRLYAWEAAFYMALRNPFTGVGLDNFYSNYFFFSKHWDGKNHAVHSTWFGVLGETGFVGLGLFTTAIYKLARLAQANLIALAELGMRSGPLYATAEGIFIGLLGTSVSGTFLTQGFTWPFYILAALIVALHAILVRQLQAAKSS